MAGVVYGLTLLVIRLSLLAMDAYTRRKHLVQSDVPDPDLQDARRKFGVVMFGYVGTILVALFFPSTAFLFYFVISIFMLVPLRIGRLSSRAR